MSTNNTYSYSKIEVYNQCPFKFKLRYLDGNYNKDDSIHTELGTAIHECEEKIAKTIVAGLPINYIALKNELILKMNQLQYKYPEAYFSPDKSKRTVATKLYLYLEQSIYALEEFMKSHPTYSIVGIEKEFKIQYKDKIFKGFIDRVFYDSQTDNYIIQDIKTYNVKIDDKELTTPLQFVIYSLAAQALYGCRPEQIRCQYYLPFCQLTQDAGSQGYLKRGENKLDKLFVSIEENNFTPSASPLCNWCEFCKDSTEAKSNLKYLCPYYSIWDRETRDKSECKASNFPWMGLENHDFVMKKYLEKLKEVK